jgi:hypothetical protein
MYYDTEHGWLRAAGGREAIVTTNLDYDSVRGGAIVVSPWSVQTAVGQGLVTPSFLQRNTGRSYSPGESMIAVGLGRYHGFGVE